MNRCSPLNAPRHIVQVLALLFLALACARDPRQLSLADAPATASSPTDLDEAERIRLEQMQRIRLRNVTQDKDEELTASQLFDLIVPDNAVLTDGDCGRNVVCRAPNAFSGCADFVCVANVHLCGARLMQSAAMLRAKPVTFTAPFGDVYQIPAQSATSKAALLREALKRVQLRLAVLTTSNACYAPGAYPGVAIPGVALPVGQQSYGPAQGTLYAEAIVDALNYAQELASDAVEAIVAVADKRRSQPSGIDKSMTDILNSRAEAAQLLIGGGGGIAGPNSATTKALCDAPELTGRGRRALEMIRRAAPSPAMLKGTLTMDAFLNGTPAAVPEGSIAVRLAYLDGLCSGSPATCPSTAAPSSLQQRTGISTEDFTQARSYLVQEGEAFARSAGSTFTPTRVSGAVPAVLSGLQFYSATRSEPAPPPPEYYAALTRYVDAPNVQGRTTPPAAGQIWTDLAHNLNDAITNIRSNRPTFVQYVKTNPGCPPGYSCAGLTGSFANQYQLIDGTLSSLLSDDPRRGVFQVQRQSNGTTTLLKLSGYATSDGIIVVGGMDALMCATRGTVEGAPCAPTVFPIATLAGETLENAHGYSRYVHASVVNALVPDSTVPIFVLKRRTQYTVAAGGYDYLIGLTLKATVTGTTYAYPIIPDLDRKAGEIIRPSHRWCTRPSLECDGTEFDARLPLENELSDDGDGVESSWKHYLALAEQAAAESHALGTEYIQNGLEVDRQAEMVQLRDVGDEQRFVTRADAELETVQDICGTSMSTEELLSEVGVNLQGLSLGKQCTTTAECCDGQSSCSGSTCSGSGNVCQPSSCTKWEDCCSGPGPCKFDCMSGKCSRTIEGILRAPTTNQNLSRIQECLGDGAVAPLSVLGTQPVCVWAKSDNPNMLCYGASAQYPCPAKPLPTGQCDSSVPAGAVSPTLVNAHTYGGVSYDVKLKLVDTDVTSSWNPCGDMRKLRHGLAARDALCPALVNSDSFFSAWGGNDLDVADKLGVRYKFDASKGPQVQINHDGSTKFSTGGLSPSSWPCVPINADCVNTPNSLFCQTVNCNNPTTAAEFRQIATVNQRVTEAAVILKARGYEDFDEVFVPAWLTAADFAQYSPFQRTGFEQLGPYQWERFWAGTTQNLGFSDDKLFNLIRYSATGSAGTIPVFFKHFPGGGPTATDYTVSLTNYGALVPLPSGLYVGPGFSPSYKSLRESAQLCGSIKSSQYAPRYTTLPQGHGSLATQQDLDNRIASDLPYLTTRFRFDDQSVADATDLLCEIERATVNATPAGTPCPGLVPENLTSEDHFSQVKDYANCKVLDFSRTVGNLILPRIPVRVIQGLHDSSQGGFPAVGGQIGAQMHRLRAALIRFGELNTAMSNAAGELRDVVDEMGLTIQMLRVRNEGERIQAANGELRGTQARVKMNQIDFQKQAAATKAALDCAGGFVSSLSSAVTSFGTSLLGGAMDCARAVAASDVESQNLNYERQIAEVELTIAQNDERADQLDQEYNLLEHARDMIRQRAAVRSIAGRMSDLMLEARASVEEITASLVEIESMRLRALRAISRATQYQSSATIATRHIDSVLDAKLDVSKRRYQRAHKNAIRLAFLAKRAIEQRLGVHLSELKADLPLVDAPFLWESSVCTAEGINYDILRNPEGSDSAESPREYAEAYIGDYVTNLKNVVESYRLEFDFQEGTDEVVASLRDDVLGVRQLCKKSLGNMLTYSGKLDELTADPAKPGWLIEGCPAGGANATCLRVAPAPDSPMNGTGVAGAAPGYVLTWGGAASSPPERLAQRVRLSPGRYRLSWYSRTVPGPPVLGVELDGAVYNAATGVKVGNAGGPSGPGAWPASSAPGFYFLPAANLWHRFYRIIDIRHEDDYLVKFIPWSPLPASRSGSLAGVMLEPLSGLDAFDYPYALPPPAYVGTESDTTRMVRACADGDGSAFRARAWTRRCERLCQDGFSGSCEHSDRQSSCYWETSFGIDQRDLEEGRIFAQAGFAAGNFNYRIEDIAVNFVGGGVRNCEGVEDAEACYASGFVPYSLKHLGPYFVRNHEGGDFDVKLFSGNIEHARGLGIERYLTNPVSSTDRELIAPYVRTEFQGRPLDGSLALRVWDAPGVDFNAIEDVQLYIKYRYWTRSQ